MTAGIVVDGVLTAGIVVEGVLTAGIVVEGGRAGAAPVGPTAGDLTAGVDVEDARAAGTLAVGAGMLVEITAFGGSVFTTGGVRPDAGVSDPCGCTGGPLIEGGGTESST